MFLKMTHIFMRSPQRLKINPLIFGYGLAAVASVMFSLKGILVKYAYSSVPYPPGSAEMENMAVLLLFLRMIFALPIYVMIFIWTVRQNTRNNKSQPSSRDILVAVLIGVMGYYFSSYLDFAGLLYLTAQFERILIYTSYPFFVILLSALFFGGRITFWMLGSLLIASLGILVIFFEGATAKGDDTALGVSLVVASAFCFALYQLFAKSVITKMGSRLFTCAAMTGACLGISIHSFLTQNASSLLNIPPTFLWMALAIAVFCTLLPSFLLNHALETIGTQVVALIGTLSPVSTIFVATLVLYEPFTMTDAIGTCLVVGGVLLFTWYDLYILNGKNEKKVTDL